MKTFARAFGFALVAVLISVPAFGQNWINDDGSRTNKSAFREIEEFPEPNAFRNASGAPGHAYWQQQVDYKIDATLDAENHRLLGTERITYHNNSPDALAYVWIQLDQNVRSVEHSRSGAARGGVTDQALAQAAQYPAQYRHYFVPDPEPFDGGDEITRVQLIDGNKKTDAVYRINATIMKVHLAEELMPGESTELEIDWAFNIPDNGRGGKELVEDGWLYVMAQWFPRLSVYDDINGWQTDQFLGQGEFYLEFGNYDVSLTVPWDHIVDATGMIQNPNDVYTKEQQDRLAKAYQTEEPMMIVGPDEIMTEAARPKNSGNITWRFVAENVRDFSFVSSKTYVMDAAGYKNPTGEIIQIHSLYPRDAMPLWDKVSTRSTIQTMKTYGRMSLEYPYPKAVNANGPVGGMEYPMIAFCGYRPRDGATQEQADATERGLISVTIHEVGHNWFPMIVASDERKWSWMDEGLNTYLQYYGELDYVKNWEGTEVGAQFKDGVYSTTQRGPAKNIVRYMNNPDQMPIMTESDQITSFGNNAYSKPATGLVLLRENVIGADAFDEAFREYSTNWAFKHPQPADFFRSIEEGTGENLDWFWRGWFYSTHYNDQVLSNVTALPADSLYSTEEYGKNYYRVAVQNNGGMIMPIHMEVTYEDGTSERFEVPVEAWRMNEKEFVKGFLTDKNVVRVELDPDELFADVDTENNIWELPTLTNEEVNTSDTEDGDDK